MGRVTRRISSESGISASRVGPVSGGRGLSVSTYCTVYVLYLLATDTPLQRGFDSAYGFFAGSQDYFNHESLCWAGSVTNGCFENTTSDGEPVTVGRALAKRETQSEREEKETHKDRHHRPRSLAGDRPPRRQDHGHG